MKNSAQQTSSIIGHFGDIKDYRVGFDHLLIDIIVIAICACICNADTWVDVEIWGKANIEWLRKFLKLPFGIPSHDTFGRVFSIIKPAEFEKRFISWTNSVCLKKEADDVIDVIPIDGKTLRRSYDKKSNRAAIHMVGAWSSKNKVSLGQIKTSEKSNEITAIPKLLDMLAIKGCIITVDAMGCQKNITHKIVDNKADYVIAVKDNQPTLRQEISDHFENLLADNAEKIDFHETVEQKDGQEIYRSYYVSDDVDELDSGDDFANINSIGMVETKRIKNGEVSCEIKFFILSFITSALSFCDCVRGHWGIENSLHWVLDVAFNEDGSRIRKKHGPENMAIIRRITLNLLKKVPGKKRSIKSKRLLAGWDKSYLEEVLGL
jgi:predicted transposase YbfD/YdcC